jgi:hypothetical protein
MVVKKTGEENTMRTVLLITLFSFYPLCHAGTGVRINDVELRQDQVNQIAQAYQMPIIPGDYWYDRKTGAWGIKCGPAVGLGVANLEMGGKLKADASCGSTGVFVNGRELHQLDLMNLQMLAGQIAPGRYWMDAELNAGREGGPALVNYKQLMAQHQTQMNGMQGAGSGSDNFWSSRFSAGNSSADGSQGYVSVPGYGPVGYGY